MTPDQIEAAVQAYARDMGMTVAEARSMVARRIRNPGMVVRRKAPLNRAQRRALKR